MMNMQYLISPYLNLYGEHEIALLYLVEYSYYLYGEHAIPWHCMFALYLFEYYDLYGECHLQYHLITLLCQFSWRHATWPNDTW